MEVGDPAPLGADGVYFLMWPGWDTELRSNRWHYARRWAAHIPVVIVQPVQTVAQVFLDTEQEPRIHNCRVLRVQATGERESAFSDTFVQLGQIAEDAETHKIRRPLLWCYNANLVGLYAVFPAIARVFHATENYFHFDFDGLPPSFLQRQRAAVEISDLTIAVSDGVAASLTANVPNARIAIVTNGCDYGEYSRGSPDPQLEEKRRSWAKIVVYAGNINARLDFVLLLRCARENRTTLIALFGPLARLANDDLSVWHEILREPNVTWFGPVSPDALPGIYAAADLGIIPYKHTQLLVENGFPLKALEMCAAALPVISTRMKPIEGLCSALSVVRDSEEFVRRVSTASRWTLTEAQKDEMRRICLQHDYDKKFVQIRMLLKEAVGKAPEPVTRFDEVRRLLFAAQWVQSAGQEWAHRSQSARIPLSVRVRWVPIERVLKGMITMGVTLRESSRRHLLAAWLACRCAGRTVSVRSLSEDLLRLHILRREMCRPLHLREDFGATITYDPEHERIVIEGVNVGSPGTTSGWDGWPVGDRRVTDIVWDHSRVATRLLFRVWRRTFAVSMGSDSIYRFGALTAIAQSYPRLVWQAFSPPRDRAQRRRR